MATIDLTVREGTIVGISARGGASDDDLPEVDLRDGMVWPCFADMHTMVSELQAMETALRIQRRRTEELTLEFLALVVLIQVLWGRHFVVENPAGSDI